MKNSQICLICVFNWQPFWILAAKTLNFIDAFAKFAQKLNGQSDQKFHASVK